MNYTEFKAANVYLRNELVGKLEKLSPYSFIFTYEENCKNSVALSLPSSQKNWKAEGELFPFFDNLVPEGWLLAYAEKFYRIDKSNRFALLLATCHKESIGAVRVVALDGEGQEVSPPPLGSQELAEYMIELIAPTQSRQKNLWGTAKKISIFLDPEEPLDSFRETIHAASMSGAQSKGLFYLNEGRLIPVSQKERVFDNLESQFIVKPSGKFEELPENEYVTMEIARNIGFEVPPCALVEIENFGRAFVIKRFDLDKGKRKRCEDFAQILCLSSENKYESSYEKLVKKIEEYAYTPGLDLYDFYRRLVFSFFIGNGDMHLKNWSLLEMTPNSDMFALSPCYDFLSTRLAIAKEPIDMGLTIVGKKRGITRETFIQFAGQFLGDHLIGKPFDELDSWWEMTEKCVKNCALSDKRKKRYLAIVKGCYQTLKK